MQLQLLGSLPGAWSLVGVGGERIYLAGREEAHELTVARLTGGAPAALGVVAAEPGARFKCVSGTLACLAGEDGGLTLLDVSEPPRGKVLGSLPTRRPIEHVSLDGKVAVVTDLVSLRTVDLSDPRAPRELGACQLANAGRVALAGGRAYVAAEYGLRIVDLADTARPRPLAYLELDGNAVAVAVEGDTAYVADADVGGVSIVDVSRPNAPRVVGRFGDWIMTGVAVDGRQLFVAGGTVEVVDVSDPRKPREVARFAPDGVELWDLVKAGDLVGAAGDQGFYLLRALS